MKKLLQVAVASLTMIVFSATADGLSSLKMNGDEVAVKDGDLMALLVMIGNGAAAFIAGCLCIYSLFRTLWDTWNKMAEYRSGRVDSLGAALEPLVTNGLLTLITFAVAVYTTSNFLGWMGQ